MADSHDFMSKHGIHFTFSKSVLKLQLHESSRHHKTGVHVLSPLNELKVKFYTM